MNGNKKILNQYQRPQEKIPLVGWVQRSETQQYRVRSASRARYLRSGAGVGIVNQYQRPQKKIPLVGWVQRSETQQNRWIMLPLMLGCAIAPPNLRSGAGVGIVNTIEFRFV